MFTRILIALIALITVGCSGIEEAAREGARQATQERITQERQPRDEPRDGEYGSDPYLDRLYDECDDGDHQSCLDLYRDSPIDSDYEDFSRQHTTSGERLGVWTDDDDAADIDIGDDLLFEVFWGAQDRDTKEAFCAGYDLLGPRAAYNAFADGFGAGAPSRSSFEDFFDDAC